MGDDIMTGSSTLDPDNFPEPPDRSLGRGKNVDALGPSDISDTGSDVVGGPGFSSNLDDDQVIDLDRGTNEDLPGRHEAGPDIGDANYDADSDYGGTGERAAAGRDTSAKDGNDIDTDQVVSIPDVPLSEDDTEFLSSKPPGAGSHRPR
jgi:hypothetical protein